MVPWTTYTGDQHIYRGFSAIGDAFQEQARRQQQQQQFNADLGERATYHSGLLGSQEADRDLRRFGLNLDAAVARERMDPSRVQPVALIDPTTGRPIPGQFAIPMTGQLLDRQSPGQVVAGAITTRDETGRERGFWAVSPSGKEQWVKTDEGDTENGGTATAPGEDSAIRQLIRQRDALQKQVEAGNLFAGVDSIPWLRWGKSRADQLTEVNKQLAEKQRPTSRIPQGAEFVRKPDPAATPAPTRRAAAVPAPPRAKPAKPTAVEPPLPEPSSFDSMLQWEDGTPVEPKSPEEVQALVKSGALTVEQGVMLLRSKFGWDE